MPEPTLFSATSGRIVILTGGKDLAVGTYTFERTTQLADVGNSLSGGYEKRKRIRKGGRLQAEVFWDSGAVPEELGIDQGDEFTADLYIGESGKKYAAVPLITDTLAVMGCTQDNVVKYNLTAYANGVIPDPSAA
jgi:hypothetical protein